MRRRLDVWLLTCDGSSTAARMLPRDHVVVIRSNPEPITYNVSTFMGMMLAKTQEDPLLIRRHLVDDIAPLIGDLTKYRAFYLIIPPEFGVVGEMLVTKFDELFGGRLNGRCYTSEQTMHAKTVVPWDKEIFISVGYKNQRYGSHRVQIPLMAHARVVDAMAVGYFVIGSIQSQFHPWFKEHAEEYRKIQERMFQGRSRGATAR